MTNSEDKTFDNAVVIGSGLSAQIAVIALNDVLPVTHVIGPPLSEVESDEIADLNGKKSHSHIFLPRFFIELKKICPDLLSELATAGLNYVPGSRFVRLFSPIFTKRMFATRWQVENVVTRSYLASSRNTHLDDLCQSATIAADKRSISAIQGLNSSLDVSPSTLVIDASGAQSAVSKQLVPTELKISESSYIGYITQFFKRSEVSHASLPDALYECAIDLGEAFLTLYPAADGWFSVTLAYDIRDKEVRKKFRGTEDLISYASQSQNVARWISDATPIGNTKTYMNPRITWNVDALSSGKLPKNYVAIGDALVTTPPTFGAGCSFLTTHIRILKELLMSGEAIGGFQSAFARGVEEEQGAFFKNARTVIQQKREAPKGVQPASTKKLKTLLRRFKPVELLLIYRGLQKSSSL